MSKERGTIPKTPLWKILIFYAEFSYWWLFRWLFTRPIEKKLRELLREDNDKS